jgi:hypothetical protein
VRRYDRPFDRWDALIWGVGLITMGVLFLLHYLDLVSWGVWKAWWPAFIIFFGLLRLLVARTPRRLGDAVTFMLLGGWFLIAANDWHGLDWRKSWPLVLVAIGVGSLARVVASFVMPPPSRDEEVHVDVHS